jgi:hypothetical protein
VSSLRYRTKIEFGVTAVVFLIAGGFAFLAWGINPSSDDAVGPRFVPMVVAVTMLCLGALISVMAIHENTNRNNGENHADDLIPPEAYEEDDFGFRDSDIRRVVAVIGCGIAYIILFFSFGYFVATLLSLFLVLLAFGNRKPMTLIGLPIIGTIIYQYIFMGLMGLHDPAGELIDFTVWSNLISGN